MPARNRAWRGFTLIELIVVIGVIAVLIGILLPVLSNARLRAKRVQCMSNLRQVGQALLMYSQEWDGWMFPPQLGAAVPHGQRWPVFVFKPAVWNPKVLLCPNDPEPAEEHSYIFNDMVWFRQLRLGDSDLGGLSSAQFIIMAEKKTEVPDYYAFPGWLHHHAGETDLLEGYRHGRAGSNYLFMDWHVETQERATAERGMNPWQAPETWPIAP
jgi:prepilin-type N-terminal cleavage/methylation domain-containing protein/prepilin-type processing-associated H-X9-DG protein